MSTVLKTEALVIVVAFVALNCSEYFYHRYVAHGFDKTYHVAHHRGQIDKSRYPAWAGIAGLVILAMFVPAGTLQGALIGFLLEIFYFLVLHTFYHSKVTIPIKTLSRLKEEHRIHHQRPQCNFGVTTRVWDRLFKTTRRVQNVEKVIAQ